MTPVSHPAITSVCGKRKLLPVFGPPGAGIFRGDSSGRRGRRRADYERYRRLIADRAARSDLVVVLTPSLHF